MIKSVSILVLLVVFSLHSFSSNLQIPSQFKEMMMDRNVHLPQAQINKNDKSKILGEGYLVESVKVFHTEESDDYKYIYNKDNQILSEIKEYLDDDQLIKQRKTNVYDSNGNLLYVTIDKNENGDEEWINISKQSNTFDSNNNLIIYLQQKWENNEWQDSLRVVKTYDSNGNNTLYTSEMWVQSENDWVQITYSSTKYDTFGRIIYSEYSDYYGQYQGSINYTYDSNGNIIEIKTGSYGENESHTSNKYDLNNNLIESFKVSYYENYYPYNDYIETFNYDDEGNLIFVLKKSWELTGLLPSAEGEWENSRQTTYIYDSKNQLISFLKQDWGKEEWINDYQYSYTYNNYGNKLTSLYERWNENNDIYFIGKETFTFDSDENLLTFVYERLIDGERESYTRLSNTYDLNNNMISSLFETWGNGYWINGQRIFEFEDSYGHKFGKYEGHKIEINWMTASSVKENQTANFQIKIFPNPASENTTISYTLERNGEVQIKITDLNGMEINVLNQGYKTLGSHEMQINTEKIPSGSYFITVSQNGIKTTKSFQIVR
jgi:Secretion system C-terminal sorting domain